MKHLTVKTYLKCSECGFQTSIWRKVGKQKQAGHIKNYFCVKCKKETKYIELKFDYNIDEGS